MTSAISTTILHFPAVPRRGRPRLSAILCTLRQRGVDDRAKPGHDDENIRRRR
jgi:hypothetical protein